MVKHNDYMKIIKVTLFEIFLTSYYFQLSLRFITVLQTFHREIYTFFSID